MRKKILIIIAVLGILSLLSLSKFLIDMGKISPLFFQLIFNRDIELKKEDSRINLLLLGIGGGNHEGPDLTDTVIFVNLDPVKNKANLVSIPRDLWVPDLKAKINTAYQTGESKKKGGGIILAKSVVEKVLGQSIDYVVRVDFAGFTQAVDIIGGVDVDVEKAFDDYQYPIEGKETDVCGRSQEEVEVFATASSQLDAFPCRYLHLSFNTGIQHMTGETALRFVRSRHAQGDEGTDFARSKRQEKVLKAMKDKAFSMETLLNPVKLASLYSALSSNIDTNIEESELDDFVRLAQKMRGAKIQSTVLDYGDDKTNRPGLLFNPLRSQEYGNQWVLIPRIGAENYKEIQEYVECEIKTGNCPIPVK